MLFDYFCRFLCELYSVPDPDISYHPKLLTMHRQKNEPKSQGYNIGFQVEYYRHDVPGEVPSVHPGLHVQPAADQDGAQQHHQPPVHVPAAIPGLLCIFILAISRGR